jgi:DNA-binding LytR/AlgR family response regulator
MSEKVQCRVAIKSGRSILLFDMADIFAIEARGNYVLLHRLSGSLMLRESISTVEEKLNSYGFVRVNRSLVVNSAWVEAIDPNSTRDYVLRVKGGRQYSVSRIYKKNLRLLAQSWIGTNGFAR